MKTIPTNTGEGPQRHLQIEVSSKFKRSNFPLNPWEAVAVGIILVVALIGVAALLALLLSDGSDEPPNNDIRIKAPRDGDTVGRPFVLTVESPTRQIADPAEGIPNAAHFHVFVDVRPFTPAGEVIPNADGIYHFSAKDLTLDLPPGEHRIVVVLGDNNDVRLLNTTVTAITVFVR